MKTLLQITVLFGLFLLFNCNDPESDINDSSEKIGKADSGGKCPWLGYLCTMNCSDEGYTDNETPCSQGKFNYGTCACDPVEGMRCDQGQDCGDQMECVAWTCQTIVPEEVESPAECSPDCGENDGEFCVDGECKVFACEEVEDCPAAIEPDPSEGLFLACEGGLCFQLPAE